MMARAKAKVVSGRKHCSVCEEVKPLSAYYSDGSVDNVKRYRPECKICYAARRERNDKKKELENEQED